MGLTQMGVHLLIAAHVTKQPNLYFWETTGVSTGIGKQPSKQSGRIISNEYLKHHKIYETTIRQCNGAPVSR